MKQLANRAAGGDLAAIRLVLTSGAALLESASVADLRERERFRESQRDIRDMSDTAIKARIKELEEATAAIERRSQKEARSRLNRE